jgi:multidrug efflux pump subunit AcrA (membrane-fusion protein)
VFIITRLSNNAKKFDIPEKEQTTELNKYVKVAKVKNDTNHIIIEGTGRIISSRKIDVSAEVQGQLINTGVTLKAGTAFKQGQIIFGIKDTEARLALQARKSIFMNLVANILPDIKIDFSESYDKWKNFFEQIEPEKTLPEIPIINNVKERTFISVKNIFSEYYTIRAEEERLKKYFFVAPFNGSITDVYAETGAIVNPGTRVATIIKTEELEMEMAVDANNIAYVSSGMPVKLFINGLNKNLTGKVIRVGNHINTQTQSVPVYIKIDDTKSINLYNGMYLSAQISAGVINNCFKLPRRALNSRDVFYVEDSILKKTTIDIVFTSSEHVYVKGLQDNTLIAVEPIGSNIALGNKVTPELVK